MKSFIYQAYNFIVVYPFDFKTALYCDGKSSPRAINWFFVQLSFSLLMKKRSTMISYFIYCILSSVRAGYVYL